METVYIACMVIGILLPLIIMVFNVFDGFCDFLPLDALELDIGDLSLSLLPFSMNSLCMASLVFGGVGLLAGGHFTVVVTNVIAGACAYVSAVLLQSMVKQLRKHQKEAMTQGSILMYPGKVVERIPENGFGSIEVSVPNETAVLFPAKSADGVELASGKTVEIVEQTEDYVLVRSGNWREEKYQ